MKTIHKNSVWAFALAASVMGCEKEDGPQVGMRNDAVQGAASPGTTARMGTTAGHHADYHTGAAATLGAVTTGVGTNTAGNTNDDKNREAEAEFKSVPEMKLDGDAELDEVEGGVRIVVEVEHAPPGVKGIHIHQTDNCSDIANKSMGDHFAPTTAKHGLPGAAPHHLGDLGNITIDKDGNGKLEITVAGANLTPNDPLSFVGKSIVIHESNDKGTGPSGDSGKPIACAPIRAD